MLAACHGRVEQQCATLLRLVPHVAAHGADEQARSAAVNVMRYFDTAARDHHADEEVDLFPALIESMAGSDAVCIADITQALTADHRRFEVQWQEIRATLARIANGESVPLNGGLTAAFTSAYAQHIEREENELLPMAARLLSDVALQQVGRAMRERRGLPAQG